MTSHAFWHPFADMAAVPGSELVLARGEGVYLWDEQGKRYIDGSRASGTRTSGTAARRSPRPSRAS